LDQEESENRLTKVRELPTHQNLFYDLCRDLKALTRGKNGLFRKSVSVKEILELEHRYAEFETKSDAPRLGESVIDARKLL
jgi:hypothetical protein